MTKLTDTERAYYNVTTDAEEDERIKLNAAYEELVGEKLLAEFKAGREQDMLKFSWLFFSGGWTTAKKMIAEAVAKSSEPAP